MADEEPLSRKWQLRLAADEDDLANQLAGTRKVAKNDIMRSALRLLARIQEVTSKGGKLYVKRRGERQAVEVWLL